MATLDTTSSRKVFEELHDLAAKLGDDSPYYANVRSYVNLIKRVSPKLEEQIETSIQDILSGRLLESSAKEVSHWLMHKFYTHIKALDALEQPLTVVVPTLGRVRVVMSRPSSKFYLEDPISRLYMLNQVGDTLCEVPMFLVQAIFSIRSIESAISIASK